MKKIIIISAGVVFIILIFAAAYIIYNAQGGVVMEEYFDKVIEVDQDDQQGTGDVINLDDPEKRNVLALHNKLFPHAEGWTIDFFGMENSCTDRKIYTGQIYASYKQDDNRAWVFCEIEAKNWGKWVPFYTSWIETIGLKECQVAGASEDGYAEMQNEIITDLLGNGLQIALPDKNRDRADKYEEWLFDYAELSPRTMGVQMEDVEVDDATGEVTENVNIDLDDPNWMLFPKVSQVDCAQSYINTNVTVDYSSKF